MLLRHAAFQQLCQARAHLLAPSPDGALPRVRAVAADIQWSTEHFTRVFEAVFGATPHQYRLQARLAQARELLAIGAQSVTEICFSTGFSSLGSFSSLFAQRMGEAPSLYRRRLRSMVTVPATVIQRVHPGCLSLMAFLPSDRTFREAPATATSAHCGA